MNGVWKATFADLSLVIILERVIHSQLGMRKQCCLMSWQDYLCGFFPQLWLAADGLAVLLDAQRGL